MTTRTRLLQGLAGPRSDRRGITLTEILITILIMGVGLVSIATLFPLGLMRSRAAMRDTRSALLARSSLSDSQARDLFDLQWITSNPWYGEAANPPSYRNPWLQDYPANIDPTIAANVNNAGIWAGQGDFYFGVKPLTRTGSGLPVVFDPLWWSTVHQADPTVLPEGYPVTGSGPASASIALSSRFGRDLRNANSPPDGNTLNPDASATTCSDGVQRITSFVPWNFLPSSYTTTFIFWPFTHPTKPSDQGGPAWAPISTAPQPIDLAADLFVSPDDVVFQTFGDAATGGTPYLNPTTGALNGTGVGSPLVPDLASGGGKMLRDWSFSWIFTGQLTTAGTSTQVDGNIVVFHNRPIAFDTAGSINGKPLAPAGELVLGAVFGYSTVSAPSIPGSIYYYAPGDNRNVLLRWNSAHTPDPDVKIGSWIADTTYDQQYGTSLAEEFSPYRDQRCNWYQVVKRSDPTDDVYGVTGYRTMVVQVGSKLLAKTRMTSGTPAVPIKMNVATFSAYVVNVYPKTLTVGK